MRYRFHLEYVPGKKLQAADCLSRDPQNKFIDTNYLDGEFSVVSSILTASENQINIIKDHVMNDETLRIIKQYCESGWPLYKSLVTNLKVKQYWHIRQDIFLDDGLLLYNSRLIIPESLKSQFLKIIHNVHQGISGCQTKAREAIYWPNMSKDIEEMVLSCHQCMSRSKANQSLPLHPHEIELLPWNKIGIDFFQIGIQTFLLIVDYFSKFIQLYKIPNKTSPVVIDTLKLSFSTHGIAKIIYSDNDTPFRSKNFIDFAKQYDITLQTSSPKYPQSNGLVERSIQTIKNLMMKTKESEWFSVILEYNNTPKLNQDRPSQMLMGRRLRTILPALNILNRPDYNTEYHINNLQQNQYKAKLYYDRKCKNLSKLRVGQLVYIKDGTRDWKKGKIIKVLEYDSYEVEISNRRLRRNRTQIIPFMDKQNQN